MPGQSAYRTTTKKTYLSACTERYIKRALEKEYRLYSNIANAFTSIWFPIPGYISTKINHLRLVIEHSRDQYQALIDLLKLDGIDTDAKMYECHVATQEHFTRQMNTLKDYDGVNALEVVSEDV